MSDGDVGWLNDLPRPKAFETLLGCCGSTIWAERVAAARPFASMDELLATADSVWAEVGHDDWRQAFEAHPRIGERSNNHWSREEQAGVDGVDRGVQDALAAGNAAYEERFGFIFLICATGKSADEILGQLQERLENDAGPELEVAAEQQRQITRLRLEKLLRS